MFSDVWQALVDFQHSNTDPNANMAGAYVVGPGGTRSIALISFYNGPTVPSGVFDGFTSLPHEGEIVTTTLLDTVLGTGLIGDNSANQRCVYLSSLVR